MEGKKILVAYFSWSGNTREAAKYIAQKLNADEFEIIREKAYPTRMPIGSRTYRRPLMLAGGWQKKKKNDFWKK